MKKPSGPCSCLDSRCGPQSGALWLVHTYLNSDRGPTQKHQTVVLAALEGFELRTTAPQSRSNSTSQHQFLKTFCLSLRWTPLNGALSRTIQSPLPPPQSPPPPPPPHSTGMFRSRNLNTHATGPGHDGHYHTRL